MAMKNLPVEDRQARPQFHADFIWTERHNSRQLQLPGASPTDAVLVAMKNAFSRDNEGAANPVTYTAWMNTGSEERMTDVTSAVDTNVIQEYLTLFKSVKQAPPKNFTVLWADTSKQDSELFWMNMHARTPTEALLICQRCALEFEGWPAREYFYFSVFEGWHKPISFYGSSKSVRFPSVLMNGFERVPRLKDPKRVVKRTYIYRDERELAPEVHRGYWANQTVVMGALAGEHQDLAGDVCLTLFDFLTLPPIGWRSR